jgi:subtilisin family serine protease
MACSTGAAEACALIESTALAEIRTDRASAVINNVFTDRVHACVRRGVSVDAIRAAATGVPMVDAELDRLAQWMMKWDVRLVGLTIDPAPANHELAAQLGIDRLLTLWVPEGTDVVRMALELSQYEGVIESADVDFSATAHVSAPNDPLFVQQWHLHNTGQVVGGQLGVSGADTRCLNAWAVAATAPRFSPITVAILDTGVSQSHPELQAVLVPGQNTVSPTTPTLTDDNTNVSHGTYCAGIAGAVQGNASGVAGISPNVRIMPVKVLQSISLGSQSACSNGVIWAADHGARVASMSLGWPSLSRTAGLDLALAYAAGLNVVLCSSAGNAPGSPIGFPAKLPEAIAVGGSTNQDQAWAGGSTGAELEIVAPAAGVLTTCDDANGLNGYAVQDGTSMASPMVAAAAALVLGVNPALTREQVRTILVNNSDDLGAPGFDATFGFGRLNVERAVRAALATVPCRADVDLSGTVTVDDIFVYLNLFFARDPRADINASLDVDLDDLFLLINTWFAGPC